MLYAQRKQVFKEYHNIVFERFWKRELDIEDPTVIAAVLSEAGANVSGFDVFLEAKGWRSWSTLWTTPTNAASSGCPASLLMGSSIGSSENLPFVREHLAN